ncbi:uncharacterized protein [Antedon mediterranea]|uniref:uncharacterized protein n=1 Tax=Antedon mediterranea TaxID=105859 RepID=UPI003AF65EFD
MDKLLKTRSASRGWATREATQLATMINSPSTTSASLTLQVGELDKRVEALDAVQSQVEEKLSDDQLNDNIGEAYDFRSRLLRTKLEAINRIAELSEQSQLHVSSSNDNNDTTNGIGSRLNNTTKLPKFEIKKFFGEISEWQTFWDQFCAVVDSTTIPKVNKFTYLKNLLSGEALNSIAGLALTDINYDIAIQSLKARFGRPERIIFSHIQALININVNTSQASTAAELWSIRDELNGHVQSLEALWVNGEKYGIILTPLILSRLPPEIRLEWARSGIGKEADLKYLLGFLKSEIERRERSEGFANTVHSSGSVQNQGTVSAMPATVAVARKIKNCIFCNRTNHSSWKCRRLRSMTYAEKSNVIKEAHACFKCLNTSHFARKCSFKCRSCNGPHHEIICQKGTTQTATPVPVCTEPVVQAATTEPLVQAATTTHSNTDIPHSHTVLQTAKVRVKGSKGDCLVTVMFDTGSDNTYVSSNVVNKVGPVWLTSKSFAFAAFGEGKPSQNETRNIYKLNVENKYGGWEIINCIEVKSICAPMFRAKVPQSSLKAVAHLPLADDYDKEREIHVDILVGLDYYWQFMGRGIHNLPEGLVAQDTVFGWVISGRWNLNDNINVTRNHNVNVSPQLLCITDISDDRLNKFWDLETIGVKPSDGVQDAVLKEFNESIRLVNERYEVKLPWKEGMKECLQNNREIAKVRLNSLSRRLAKDKELGEKYEASISEMERLGIIAEADTTDSGIVYYLPHHPVVKDASFTTKVRVVFDASTKCNNGISLNDCLETGPPLIPGLVDILLRFRRWKIGLTSDITKAFLQIKVHKDDQNVHRFLWKREDKIRTMKFLRVPFGNASSPFLLNATIRHHLTKYPSCLPITELQDNLYVDDWLTGADYYEDALLLFQQAKEIMAQGKFPLTSWNSNNTKVTEMFFNEFDELLQDIWLLNLGWDEHTPEIIQQRFDKWIAGLESLRNWEIPRCYTPALLWSDMSDIELHGGISAGDLVSSGIWLDGPAWLANKFDLPTHSVSLEEKENVKPETQSALLVELCPPNVRIFDVLRWGTLDKAVRITALCKRFVKKLKGPCDFPENFSHDELAMAKLCLFQQQQEVAFGQELDSLKSGKSISGSSPLSKLRPFMGPDGLLRITGRLQQADLSYDEKHPIILPKGHFTTLLIRSFHVKLQNAGVDTVINVLRNTYWILGVRKLMKSVKKRCMPCQKVDSLACNEVAAPLPELRVHQAPPFTVTGLDYAGPLFCLDFPHVKFDILLFTCAVVRAVHLELTESLTQKDCMLALRRFTSRRGVPSVFYSDNAKTFVGARTELSTLFGEEGPKWKFIAPRSPWWGGWWERLVRSIKGALKKSIGSKCLKRTELETSLQEVEACVNSRPLTFVGDEVDTPKALTPSHFLIGKVAGFQNKISELEVEITRANLCERELVRQRRLELFWEVWSKEYLRNLPPTINKFKSKGNVGLGSLVLIREDNIPRMKWPLGRIAKEFPGRDGVTRCFELKTCKGNLVRAIQRLHNLELDGGSNILPQSVYKSCEISGNEKKPKENNPRRSSRTIKPIDRLDL